MGLAISNALAERYPVRLSGLVADGERVLGDPGDLIAALQHDLAEVSDRAAKLDTATRVRHAQLLDQASRLAAEIEALVEVGDAVFAIPFDDPRREARLAQCLTPMKAIGDLTEDLRPFLGPKLFTQVRALRQGLIDGTYLVLATLDTDLAAWRLHAEAAQRSAVDLRSALSSVQGPALGD